MKELTTEQKAKRYDEAIDVCRKLYNDAKANGYTSDIEDYEQIFPELKESDDEKIREELIEFVKSRGGFKQEYIAWLEKQGEQKFIPKYKVGDTIYYNSFGEVKSMIVDNVVTDDTDNPMYEDVNGSAVFEKDLIEQKPVGNVEPKFNIGDKIQYLKGCGTIMTIEKIENGEYIFSDNMGHTTIESGNKWYLVEQKPTDNIELSVLKDKLLELFQRFRWYCKDKTLTNGDIIEYVDAHIQELINIIQNKPWSEEDELQMKGIIDLLPGLTIRHNWLKSLKGRCSKQWKPSEEQINALVYATDLLNTYNAKETAENGLILLELIKQLKAL